MSQASEKHFCLVSNVARLQPTVTEKGKTPQRRRVTSSYQRAGEASKRADGEIPLRTLYGKNALPLSL